MLARQKGCTVAQGGDCVGEGHEWEERPGASLCPIPGATTRGPRVGE
jgi:hypothetical protein